MLNNISAADVRHLTDKIADTFDSCADACSAAGVGQHPVHGHAAIARRLASHLRSEAALGRLPHRFDDNTMYAAADVDDEPATLSLDVKNILDQYR